MTDFTVVADGIRKQQPPKGFIQIKLTFTVTSPDVEQGEFEKMGRLAATKYCSVADSLNIQAEHVFKIIRPDGL